MTDNTSTEFKPEGEKNFVVENNEKDNSSDSSSDKTTENQTQSQEGDQNSGADKDDKGNFADHPRWKERETDWTKRFNDQEQRHTDELSRLREEFEEKYGNGKSKAEQNEDLPAIPSWFGGDEDAWREYLKDEDVKAIKIAERALIQITERQESEKKAVDEATQYFNSTIEELENNKELNPTGEKIDRNKILKLALDNDLVDSKGRWNYLAAFKMMKAGTAPVKDENKVEKKRVAFASTSENRGETKNPSVSTSDDLKGKNWGDL